MKSHFIGPFLLWLEERGYPVREWLAANDVSPEAIGHRAWHLSHATYCELLEVAEARSGEAALGLAFAQSTPRMYAFMEALWQNCADVEGAIGTWSYYAKAMAGRMAFRVSSEPGRITITQTCDAYDLRLERLSNEFLIAWILLQLQVITRVDIVPLEVAFAHPAPSDTSRYVEVFGTSNILFDRAGNSIVLDERDKSRPVVLADPNVYEALAKRADSMPPPDGNVVSRLPSTIEELLASGQPQIEDVAKSLGVSVRTLQRRIAENQSTFQREVERVREQMARALVGHGQVTLTEIASRLGYGDPSAFFRAFKRWTGVTPTEFRAQRA